MKTMKIWMMCLFQALSLVQSQLTVQIKNSLANIAQGEILIQMMNESDNTKSLLKLVQAGHILEIFDSKIDSRDEVCQWLQRTKEDSAASAQTVYLRNEASRLMRCNNQQIKFSAQSLLDDVSRVSKFEDFYYAGLLNQNASLYGLQFSQKSDEHL